MAEPVVGMRGNALRMPHQTLLGGQALLEVGDVGRVAVAARARVRELLRIAQIAVGGKVLDPAAAHLETGVAFAGTPCCPGAERNAAGVDVAAVGGVARVLGRADAGEGRQGEEKGRVEHGWSVGESESESMNDVCAIDGLERSAMGVCICCKPRESVGGWIEDAVGRW